MGGYNAGEVASVLCANWFIRDYYVTEINEPVKERLDKEIISLNERLSKLSNEYEQYKGMGTTLVSLLVKDKKAIIHNVGDSRLYIFADKLKQITEDHSEVWKLYKKGFITKDEIIHNRKKNIITQSIGFDSEITPNSYEIGLPKQFLFFLCSDGITDVMIDREIEAVIKAKSSLQEIADSLYDLSQEKGSKDDASIILVSNYLKVN
jgi:protein phosphatase